MRGVKAMAVNGRRLKAKVSLFLLALCAASVCTAEPTRVHLSSTTFPIKFYGTDDWVGWGLRASNCALLVQYGNSNAPGTPLLHNGNLMLKKMVLNAPHLALCALE